MARDADPPPFDRRTQLRLRVHRQGCAPHPPVTRCPSPEPPCPPRPPRPPVRPSARPPRSSASSAGREHTRKTVAPARARRDPHPRSRDPARACTRKWAKKRARFSNDARRSRQAAAGLPLGAVPAKPNRKGRCAGGWTTGTNWHILPIDHSEGPARGHEKRRIDRCAVRSRQPVGFLRPISERERSFAGRLATPRAGRGGAERSARTACRRTRTGKVGGSCRR